MTDNTAIQDQRDLLEISGLFDVSNYVKLAGEGAVGDPITHYLTEGWRRDLRPNPTFPAEQFRPYFRDLGLEQSPFTTWLTLQWAGWALPWSAEELTQLAAEIRSTGLFDEEFYLTQLPNRDLNLDAALHYALVGERLGFRPSLQFDSVYYRERYHDVAQSGFLSLLHYHHFGSKEGRRPGPVKTFRKGGAEFDDGKENVILVVHETSRTGAPILGWNVALRLAQTYNVHLVHLGDGKLTADFEALCTHLVGPFLGEYRNSADIDRAFPELLGSKHFQYAIVNSVESRITVELFARRFIPAVLLVHEFGSYTFDTPSLRAAYDLCAEIVFPARIVAEAAVEVHPELLRRQTNILPQGPSNLPIEASKHKSFINKDLAELIRKRKQEGCFLVLGAGAVQIRKGVDLFIATALSVSQIQGQQRPIHFLWVGHGFRPKEDFAYSVYLHEQIKRSNMEEMTTLLDEVADLEPIYRMSDAFLLSSRLDPLPNVSIDAALRGIPIVCFRDASGAAEILLESDETATCVVPHMDAHAAAEVIVRLASSPETHRRVGDATRELAHQRFDMATYVDKLDHLGKNANVRMRRQAIDAATLLEDDSFDQDMFLGSNPFLEQRKNTVIRYLAMATARGWDAPEASDIRLRRPKPGFNPRIYASAHPTILQEGIDPLADFIRCGKPEGPWQLEVIGSDSDGTPVPETALRVALHVHMFYPELAFDFFAHLNSNHSRCDLLVSTDTVAKAERLQAMLPKYSNGKVDIRVMLNRGRDIGPFLTGFASELLQYDIVGHVHSKRSAKEGWTSGDAWREFLWQNLLGGLSPMLDRIVSTFEHQPDLGLVFPSDPHLVGWDQNRRLADALAARLGWHGRLPEAFDFPLGTMFWFRLDALRPLLNLNLDWSDYPSEPLPEDGTLLHALERIMPFVCRQAGYRFAVTHLFGVSWSA